MTDVAPPGLPPPADPANGRHQHLVYRRADAALTVRVVQGRSYRAGCRAYAATMNASMKRRAGSAGCRYTLGRSS